MMCAFIYDEVIRNNNKEHVFLAATSIEYASTTVHKKEISAKLVRKPGAEGLARTPKGFFLFELSEQQNSGIKT